MRYSGARILVESLIGEGVDTVFGMPGAQVLQIYDELSQYRDRIRHILVSHEQHAAHAADGYARSSGRTGVCLATSGPGATNLVTGIAAAWMDSSPVVAITGNVPLHLLGKDSFQEVDIAGITMPIVKHNWIVKDVNELAEVIREAFIVARSGRPGPVLVDIPSDICAAETEWEPALAVRGELAERARRLSERNERVSFAEAGIERAAAMLLAARRPVIYAGGGVVISGAQAELAGLAIRLNAPVALSLMGIGAFPHGHRLYTGLVGMHGTVASNRVVQKADLLIAAGSRFSERVTSRTDHFARNAKILHLDIDPAEVNKNIRADFSVIGDLKKILGEILKKLPAPAETPLDGETKNTGSPKPEKNSAKLHPRFIMEETAKQEKDVIVVTDVGQHQIWAARYCPVSTPRSFISSGGLGAMGFGLGAALGAKLANPGRSVVLFSGDGSFRMNCAELATLRNYGIPVLIVVIHNGALGMVRQWQKLFYSGNFSETSLGASPDFSALAAAYGVPDFRAGTCGEFRAAAAAAWKLVDGGGAALIEARIDIDELVLPMVPGGRPVDEQIL
jgi:acetolactate synthase-1/2/3 large subunit